MTIELNAPQPNDDDHWLSVRLPDNTPQPITIKIDGYMISLLKQDVEIVRFNVEDLDSMQALVKYSNGLLRGGIIAGELENIRDIIKECKQGLEHEK
jgi:hypothetical protein